MLLRLPRMAGCDLKLENTEQGVAINLLPEEGDDRGRPSVDQTAGRGTRTTMMDDSRNTLEKPLYPTISRSHKA